MDKILVRKLPTETLNGRQRVFCIVKCPDCSTERKIRYDAYKSAHTTCCRSCTNLRRETKDKEDLFDPEVYYKTKEGKLAQILIKQKQRCKKKNWPLPSYTREELLQWAMSQELYHALFEQWERSNYEKLLCPSVDRIDDYKSYTLDNIQLMTWEQNNLKGYISQKLGVNTKNCIAVDQLTMEGEFIARHHSMKSAARVVNMDDSKIGQVCRGVPIKKGNRYSTPRSAGGYKWRFSTIPNPPDISPMKAQSQT